MRRSGPPRDIHDEPYLRYQSMTCIRRLLPMVRPFVMRKTNCTAFRMVLEISRTLVEAPSSKRIPLHPPQSIRPLLSLVNCFHLQPMTKRVTCREIAQALGISHSSVSLALRNHPSLPEKTREKIQNKAQEMGYRPDPALSALNAYRQNKKGVKYQSTLAWVSAYQDANFANSEIQRYFLGASERAQELGYTIECFWLPDRNSWRQLYRTLKARGISGVFFPYPGIHRTPPDWHSFPWEEFSVVAIGELPGIEFHLVVNDQYRAGFTAVGELYKLGYRNIGLIMPWSFAVNTEFHFYGGYASACAQFGVKQQILLGSNGETAGKFQTKTAQWIRKKKPDVIIASQDGDILPTLKQLGLVYPKDIAVAFLAYSPDFPEIAGIEQNGWQAGAVAANQLVELVRCNERGLPQFPRRALVEGIWMPASSAPSRKTAEI